MRRRWMASSCFRFSSAVRTLRSWRRLMILIATRRSVCESTAQRAEGKARSVKARPGQGWAWPQLAGAVARGADARQGQGKGRGLTEARRARSEREARSRSRPREHRGGGYSARSGQGRAASEGEVRQRTRLLDLALGTLAEHVAHQVLPHHLVALLALVDDRAWLKARVHLVGLAAKVRWSWRLEHAQARHSFPTCTRVRVCAKKREGGVPFCPNLESLGLSRARPISKRVVRWFVVVQREWNWDRFLGSTPGTEPSAACLCLELVCLRRPSRRPHVPSETHRTKTQNNAATFPAQHPTRCRYKNQQYTGLCTSLGRSAPLPQTCRHADVQACRRECMACRRAGMQT